MSPFYGLSPKFVRWVIGFCLLLVIVCYANAVANDFVLDDIVVIANNPAIRTLSPLRFLSTPYWGDQIQSGIYRPLTISFFALEYKLWKRSAPGFRIANLVLHSLNGFLVFLLVFGFIGSAYPALAAAAVYLIHPAHTEAVVSVVGQAELLAAAFLFSAWLVFRAGRIWLSAILFLLSLLSKESAIVFPAIVAIGMWLSGSREEDRSNPVNAATASRLGHLGILAATAAGYLALRLWILGGFGVPRQALYQMGSLSLVERWMTSGRAFLHYFRLVFVPVSVTGDYDYNSVQVAGLTAWDAWLGLVLVACSIGFAVWIRKKNSQASLGILFFFVALLPVSNWILPIGVLVAERFLYTPIFGIALLAGIAWTKIPTEEQRLILGAGAASICILLCIGHNYIWQDTFTFYKNVVREFPDNARGRLGYGFALLDLRRFDEAEAEFNAGLRIIPGNPALISAVAVTRFQQDRNCSRAWPLLKRALELEPNQWHSYWVLGDCYAAEQNSAAAAHNYRRAIESTSFPDARLFVSWGLALEQLGERDAAIAAYRRGALIDPNLQFFGRKIAALTGPTP